MSPEKARPITPKEVPQEKLKHLPDVVIQTFNELIAQGGSGSVTIRQSDVLTLLVRRGLSRHEIFENGWLDIEDIYRKAGWIVEYDKPAYNETYEPTFTFRPKGKGKRE